VSSVVSGYAGGTAKTATYEKYHDSNHAEAVKITYDPHVVTYGQLLRILFSTSEPTVKDMQGPDAGHQYRMAVFYENDDQRKVAEAYIKQLTDAKVYSEPIQTTVEPMPNGFFPAEDYHQHYFQLHPENPYVANVSAAKVARFRDIEAAEVSGKLVGKPAPDVTLTGTDGTAVKISDLKGHVVVLDFWATWCPACVQSLPQLNQLWEDTRSQGVKVFAVNVGQAKDDITKFVTSNRFTFPVLMDSDGAAAQAYGAEAIPQTVVIGKDGKVRKVFVGIGQENERAIRAAVEAALSEK
jgi:methionine-S-sulfoxide reductase